MTTPPIISLPPDPPAYFVWLYSALLAACIGGIDYITKGLAVDYGMWPRLPWFQRGYYWAAVMFVLYLLSIIALANISTVYYWGILLFFNEDLFYWIWRFLINGRSIKYQVNKYVYWLLLITTNGGVLWALMS